MRRGEKVELTLGTLVLEGVPRGRRHRVAAALEHELARLLARHGVPEAWRREGVHPRVDGGGLSVPPSAPPRAFGEAVARAVYGAPPVRTVIPLPSTAPSATSSSASSTVPSTAASDSPQTRG